MMFGRLFSRRRSSPEQPVLDYDRAIGLDAEDLAEGGIASAYAKVIAALEEILPEAWQVEERLDTDLPSYSVVAAGVTYDILGPGIDEAQSWGRAAHALFDIVNRQLAGGPRRFYALNGGHDLQGILLAESEATEACKRLPRRGDWPYLPVLEPPDFGAPTGAA